MLFNHIIYSCTIKYIFGAKPFTIWSGAEAGVGQDGNLVDAGAGDDWVISGGGSDYVQGGLDDDSVSMMVAIYFVAYRARNPCGLRIFNCRDTVIEIREPCTRWGFGRSNIKKTHPRPMRQFVGHKGLGRCMNKPSSTSRNGESA